MREKKNYALLTICLWNKTFFSFTMQSMDVNNVQNDYQLLKICPTLIESPTQSGKTYYSKGEFTYYHYGCDGHIDVVGKQSIKTTTTCRKFI